MPKGQGDFADPDENIAAQVAFADPEVRGGDQVPEGLFQIAGIPFASVGEEEMKILGGTGQGDQRDDRFDLGQAVPADFRRRGGPQIKQGPFDAGELSEEVVGVIVEKITKDPDGGLGIGRQAVNLGNSPQVVTAENADLIGCLLVDKAIENRPGPIDVGVGVGLQVEESEGLAEEAFTSQSGINHDLVAKDPVGVAVEQQNGVLPGIHQRLGTVLSARGDR